MRILRIELSNHMDTEKALATVTETKADAVLRLEHLAYATLRRDLAMCALRARVPMISTTIGSPLPGALSKYGPDSLELAEATATYVGKLLQGVKASALPIEQP